MFSNIKQEYASELALRFRSRNATEPGDPVDCEPDSSDLQKKYRFVFITVITGAIAGNHEVTLEQGPAVSHLAAVQGVTTGRLAPDSVSVLAYRRGDKNSNNRFIRVVHNVVGGQAGVVGAILHRPKKPAASEIDLELVMRHCVYSLGVGAGMPIQSYAIEKVCLHVRDAFAATLSSGGADPVVEWNNMKYFLLSCCQEIGRRAAQYARENAQIAIPFATAAGNRKALKEAYNEVSKANTSTGGAGEYCPEID